MNREIGINAAERYLQEVEQERKAHSEWWWCRFLPVAYFVATAVAIAILCMLWKLD